MSKKKYISIEVWNELVAALHPTSTIKGKIEINKEKLIEAAKDPDSFDKFIDELIRDTYRDIERKVVCKWLEDKDKERKNE